MTDLERPMRIETLDAPAARRARRGSVALVLALGLAACAGPARAGVDTALVPATQTVEPDSAFSLSLDVTLAGSPFNGFDAVIAWDPAALTLLPSAPLALQQGCLMTGGCSGACGTTFHQFAAAGDSAEITDILLCDQVFLTGPGRVYTLRFHASPTPQTTQVTVRAANFYHAGLFVTPVTTASATIEITPTVGVPGRGASAAVARMRAEPNPARGPLTFVIESGVAGEQSLEVLDVTGRVVRRFDRGWHEAGVRRVAWDGADGGGAPLPPGVYLARLRAGGAIVLARVARVR